MTEPSSPSERLGHALGDPSRGVLGLVDELLEVSGQQDIRLEWQAGHCRVSFPGAGPPDRIEVPLQKSVIRAVLARVAVLCNESIPDSVSPYGGQGELAIRTDPSKIVRVEFINTPEIQSLDLASMRIGGRTQTLSTKLSGPARRV